MTAALANATSLFRYKLGSTQKQLCCTHNCGCIRSSPLVPLLSAKGLGIARHEMLLECAYRLPKLRPGSELSKQDADSVHQGAHHPWGWNPADNLQRRIWPFCPLIHPCTMCAGQQVYTCKQHTKSRLVISAIHSSTYNVCWAATGYVQMQSRISTS